MKTKPLILSIAYLFLFVSLPVLLGLDMDDGLEAMQRGDDKEAAKYFHLAAEQGNVKGQIWLGLLYSGEGPLKDNKKAAKFTRLAAEQGHPNRTGYARVNVSFWKGGSSKLCVIAYVVESVWP